MITLIGSCTRILELPSEFIQCSATAHTNLPFVLRNDGISFDVDPHSVQLTLYRITIQYSHSSFLNCEMLAHFEKVNILVNLPFLNE